MQYLEMGKVLAADTRAFIRLGDARRATAVQHRPAPEGDAIVTGTSSHFRNLPATPLAWSGVGLAIIYFCGALILARGTVAANLPEWSLWAYGLGFGALALALLIAAYARKERSWLILVGVVLAAFWWLQWVILGFIGLFIR